MDDSCSRALANVRQAVDVDRRFPHNVFVGDWSVFYFFDSDWMKDAEFVEHAKAILQAEGGACACLWKLDSDQPQEIRSLFLQEKTSTDAYLALLAGQVPGYGWLDSMDRLACASDSGAWCMYCEPNNEIAVIAFRESGGPQLYLDAMAGIQMVPFDAAVREPPLSYGYSERALSPEWREVYSREYAVRRR